MLKYKYLRPAGMSDDDEDMDDDDDDIFVSSKVRGWKCIAIIAIETLLYYFFD